jgi:type III secretion system low calcium response chaperone LcrH/SycD
MAEQPIVNNNTPNADAETSNEELISSEELHGYIKTAVNKAGHHLSKEEKKEHAKLLLQIFEKGMSPKQAMKISDEEMAQIYSFAYHHFNSGKYSDAREMFKLMLMLDPLNIDFATSLGICHHRLKNFDLALPCYMLAAFLDIKNPVCYFYAYDCYVNLKDELSAAIMLGNVIARAGNEAVYAHIKNDAQARLDPLLKKLEAAKQAETTK